MVRMYHDDPSKTGGPTTADVPEEAVSWMRQSGWHQTEGNAENLEAEAPAEEEAEAEAPKRRRAKK